VELVRRGLGTGSGVVVGGEAEDFVHLEDEVAAFGLGEFAIGVLESLEGSAGLGAGVAVFLDEHGFPAGTGQSVDETDEGGGIAAQFEIELAAGAEIFDF
jgi:hypothetical protein